MRSLLLLLPILLMFSSCNDLPILGAGNGQNEAMSLKMTAESIEVMQDIKADFIFTNVTSKKIGYGFPSSCQHGFKVKKGAQTLFDSQYAYGCLTVLTSLELKSGESETYKIDLSHAGEFEYLDSGTYSLEAFLLTENSDTVSTTFTVE